MYGTVVEVGDLAADGPERGAGTCPGDVLGFREESSDVSTGCPVNGRRGEFLEGEWSVDHAKDGHDGVELHDL